jgi:hypothetical protein
VSDILFSKKSVAVGDVPQAAMNAVMDWLLKDAPRGCEVDVTAPDGRVWVLRLLPAQTKPSGGQS